MCKTLHFLLKNFLNNLLLLCIQILNHSVEVCEISSVKPILGTFGGDEASRPSTDGG
jgi:hypothetical protein